jgi:hypothetical protein
MESIKMVVLFEIILVVVCIVSALYMAYLFETEDEFTEDKDL